MSVWAVAAEAAVVGAAVAGVAVARVSVAVTAAGFVAGGGDVVAVLASAGVVGRTVKREHWKTQSGCRWLECYTLTLECQIHLLQCPHHTLFL